MIRNRFVFRWMSFVPCSSCDDEVLDLMQEGGCLDVHLGIERGDLRVLNNMNKSARTCRYYGTTGKFPDREILALSPMIVGFPGETAETVQDVIAFLNQDKSSFCNARVYYHDAEAPIEKRREQSGRIIHEVRHSLQLPLYGFSIWIVAYLLAQGLSPQILHFTGFANTASHAELRGERFDPDEAVSALLEHPDRRRPAPPHTQPTQMAREAGL